MQPTAKQLSAALKGGASQARYLIEVTNYGPDDVADLLLSAPLPTGLNSVLWSCAAPSPCRPGNGIDAVSTRFDLSASESATIELLAEIDSSQRFVEISANATLPAGVNLISTGEERRVLIEPISAEAVYRSSFE
nr:DUF11 domain-containing protein [Pseudomarimonas arenosa]